MKVKLKIETQWLELERKSMSKMKKDYEDWERETLKKAKDAKDLRSLREVFYQMGDRWEFDQATGAWLSDGEPLDAVGLILKMPGLEPNKERFVLYAVMAYSKGFTQQFDHLGDKERIIVERDTKSGKLAVWSTTGHGAMDLYPADLSAFDTLEKALESSHLVAQPGDHALRLETPHATGWLDAIAKRLWEIAGGNKQFSARIAHILLEDKQVFCTGTDDADHIITRIFHGSGDRQHRGNTYPAADTAYRAVILNRRGMAERPGHVTDTLAGMHIGKIDGRFADGLDNQA